MNKRANALAAISLASTLLELLRLRLARQWVLLNFVTLRASSNLTHLKTGGSCRTIGISVLMRSEDLIIKSTGLSSKAGSRFQKISWSLLRMTT